jgi:hypothetical protein
MTHVASPSTAANRAECDDDYEHRRAEHENRGIERRGQKKQNEYLGDGKRPNASKTSDPFDRFADSPAKHRSRLRFGAKAISRPDSREARCLVSRMPSVTVARAHSIDPAPQNFLSLQDKLRQNR